MWVFPLARKSALHIYKQAGTVMLKCDVKGAVVQRLTWKTNSGDEDETGMPETTGLSDVERGGHRVDFAFFAFLPISK
jgi:hypothetical protein